MKFFKQTKETKRKISFFMALAMVISLLPVSPVVKAATSDSSYVYLSVDTVSAEYVKFDKVLNSKGAVTASVIIAPENGVTFTNVNAGSGDVKTATAVTLGSISLKKGGVATEASVVVREKAGNTGNSVVSVSPSSLSGSVIAKASLTATGPAITGTSKNITGAVISIDGIVQGKDIEVAIVMESGKTEVIPDSDFTVKYSGTIENADIKVSLSGKDFATGSKVKATDTLDITITPN
ncbi:MAG: hypothetical protein K2K35_02530, partial [Lachnospiraceae bacterium]|nr:hypothetical protein [Lachnospiraceae bacterium]